VGLANQALQAARTVHTADNVVDAFRIARAYRFIGDFERDRGNLVNARSAWNNGLSAIPKGVAEQPDEIFDHAALLERLGRSAEAGPLAAKLNSIGYHLQM
jgi:hypothetical protein